MSRQKIIDGLKDAIAGNLDRVTIDGQAWERTDLAKRPVAWRVKESADRWAVYQDEATAVADSDLDGAEMQGLYIRNGL